MYITPKEACEMLQDERANDFREGLLTGKYKIKDKYIKELRKLSLAGWVPKLIKVIAITDGENEIIIE